MAFSLPELERPEDRISNKENSSDAVWLAMQR